MGVSPGQHRGEEQTIRSLVRPKLIGKDPFETERIEAELGSPLRGRWEVPPNTMAAIDGALRDIIGESCGKPLHRPWGGRVNEKVHVRYRMPCREPEAQAAEAVWAVVRGWRAFKIKLGTDPKTDLERVRAVREAVGEGVQLCFDMNGAYPPPVAINFLKRIARYEPAYVEEPVPNHWPYSGSLEAMAEIRRITGVPIEAHSHGPNCP